MIGFIGRSLSVLLFSFISVFSEITVSQKYIRASGLRHWNKRFGGKGLPRLEWMNRPKVLPASRRQVVPSLTVSFCRQDAGSRQRVASKRPQRRRSCDAMVNRLRGVARLSLDRFRRRVCRLDTCSE